MHVLDESFMGSEEKAGGKQELLLVSPLSFEIQAVDEVAQRQFQRNAMADWEAHADIRTIQIEIG
ncbi:MAG TPA: hypothetical protein VFD86_09825, partial [Nitrospira sp.]|nr:hypothetical protein [Nitrospira sp.]